jgi:ubiquinone/menaquinone biosynthesis C-methylase UbiE
VEYEDRAGGGPARRSVEIMVSVSAERAEAGHTVYTKSVLAFYDLFVLRFSNRFIWRCPSKHFLALYDRHVTSNHLDVGVGTGFFLDRCRFPMNRPRLALMDLNVNCLDVASKRLARYRPERYRANVLDPIRFDASRFESIGMNYLLHCLPGTVRTKCAVFRHLKPLLNPGGVMFGATLLHGGVHRSWAASQLMALYNSKGIFTNNQDDLEGLREVLARNLTAVTVEVVGCAALFSGRA